MYYLITPRCSGKTNISRMLEEMMQEIHIPSSESGLPKLCEEIRELNFKEMRENMQTAANALNIISQQLAVAGILGNERVGSHIFVPTIDRIYYNTKKRTVVIYWSTGESTKVTCAAGETFDVELGIRLAVCKYALGNSSTVSKGIIAKAVEKANNTTKE